MIFLLSHPHPAHASHGPKPASTRPRGRAIAHPVRLARPPAPDHSMAGRILAFARTNLGRQVGSGECYDLADAALHYAGAHSAPDYGEITSTADYVWGRPVALRDARPGDIVQFSGYSRATWVTTTLRQPDGSTDTQESWDSSVREHHTAIVERNEGGFLALLEQNVPPLGPRVQRTELPIASMTLQGAVPNVPNESAVWQIEVAGIVRAYRPQRNTDGPRERQDVLF